MADEIQRGQRLSMAYEGARWVKARLGYAASAGRKVKGKPVRDEMSPLGVTVAEVLGFVWRGIYHLDHGALMRAEWWDEGCIKVAVDSGTLSTWDFNYLTALVVVCHDLGLRLSVNTHGPRMLALMFHQRTARTGSGMERMPTIEEHIGLLRKGYAVALPSKEPL